MNNLPMGDALAYLENEARPVTSQPTAQEVSNARWMLQHQDVVMFLDAYTGSFPFLLDMVKAFKQWGRLTDRQLAAVQKCMASEAAYKARQQATETNHASTWGRVQNPSALDLSKIPSGHYAVPGGDTRLKVRIDQGTNKWEGFTFVKDGAEYGSGQRYGMQRPGQAYSGMILEQLKVIAADPAAASRAYGRLVGRCGVCGRKLEDAASVAAGIGPICASKF